DHCAPAILGSAEAGIGRKIHLPARRFHGRTKLIIERQFFPTNDIARGVKIYVVLEDKDLAVRLAAMIDEAGIVAAACAIDHAVAPETKNVSIRSHAL